MCGCRSAAYISKWDGQVGRDGCCLPHGRKERRANERESVDLDPNLIHDNEPSQKRGSYAETVSPFSS